MKQIKRKLQSHTGATLILALLFFVICAAIGSVILTAATASAGRISSIKSSDQGRYAKNSAVKVIKKQFTAGEFSEEFTFSKTGVLPEKKVLRSAGLNDGELQAARDAKAQEIVERLITTPDVAKDFGTVAGSSSPAGSPSSSDAADKNPLSQISGGPVDETKTFLMEIVMNGLPSVKSETAETAETEKETIQVSMKISKNLNMTVTIGEGDEGFTLTPYVEVRKDTVKDETGTGQATRITVTATWSANNNAG